MVTTQVPSKSARAYPLSILFFGSPSVAVPSLEAILASEDRIAAVVTQPDRPAGRGRIPTPPPVALIARERKLPLFQPARIRNDPDLLATLRGLRPDLIVVVAFGQILPREILDLPPLRCVNLHFSLLPKYRGAAPCAWAIINGETETGVTTLFMTDKVDAGPILLQRKVPIESEDNAEILGHRLSIAGADLLLETLKRLKGDDLKPVPQNDRLATAAPLLNKEDGRIDWTKRSKNISNRVRGMTPWPGAHTSFGGKLLKLFSVEPGATRKKEVPGTILFKSPEGLEVACGQGALLIKELQIEGKRRMKAAEFLNGHPVSVGDRLGGNS